MKALSECLVRHFTEVIMTTAQSKRRVLVNNKNPFQLIAQSFIVQKCAVQQYDYQHLTK